MVKKIQGKKTARTSGTTPVQATKTVESSKVGQVDQVKAGESTERTGSVGNTATPITPELREQLFQMIDEEAEKMFGDDNEAAEKRKATVKGAVKMALQSGVLPEDE
jgi:hypothetical protein